MNNVSIVVAFNKYFGIGKDGTIPWHIPDDLKHFRELTKDSVCVMGNKTYLSIPEKNRPLKDRLNVIVTSDLDTYKMKSNPREIYINEDELGWMQFDNKKIFICGGEYIYKKYVGVVDTIYATIIEDSSECDKFFPIENFHKYEIVEYSDLLTHEAIKYRFVKYQKTTHIHDEFQYLNLLKNVSQNGITRPDRTGVGTKSIFAPDPLRFDISKSIPLYTTKFVGIKMIIKELLWFLRGETDSKILEKQGVNIWKDNTSREFLDKRGLHHYREGDLGPMYGHIFKHFNAEYKGCDANYSGQGVDQIANLIHGLKTDPFSRRHLITSFNPATVDQCVLYPCHGIAIMFYVDNERGLSCHVTIRSNDLLLGNPFNVTSYAVFVYIIAKQVDMKPKDLIISIADAHEYLNHEEAIKIQLSRSPLPFPVLEVNDSVKNKKIEEIEVEDFELIGYIYHPAIKAPMAI